MLTKNQFVYYHLDLRIKIYVNILKQASKTCDLSLAFWFDVCFRVYKRLKVEESKRAEYDFIHLHFWYYTRDMPLFNCPKRNSLILFKSRCFLLWDNAINFEITLIFREQNDSLATKPLNCFPLFSYKYMFIKNN